MGGWPPCTQGPDVVSTHGLRTIKGVVGCFHEFVEVQSIVGEDGNADRDGHAAAEFALIVHCELPDRLAQFLGSLDQLLPGSLRQN